MIAPIRDRDENTSPALREARRVVAMLLPAECDNETPPPAVPAWQAWLLVAWMAVTTCVFLSTMFGVWRGQ